MDEDDDDDPNSGSDDDEVADGNIRFHEMKRVCFSGVFCIKLSHGSDLQSKANTLHNF